MKYVFIVNPTAGKGKAQKLLPEIEKDLKTQKLEYKVYITERPLHATELVTQLSYDEDCCIYTVGGDGTLNEVVNGLVNRSLNRLVNGLVDKNYYLGIIPAGTGNDFIRNFFDKQTGNEAIVDMQKLTKHKPATRKIDIGKVNGKFFINIASAGFDGQVAHWTNQLKRLPLIKGMLAYYLGIVITLLANKSYKMILDIDGKIIKSDIALVAVANGKYYGGGIMAAPNAKIDDGLFDVCVVEKLTRLRILRFLPRFIKGKHEGIRGVTFYKAKKINLWCEGGVPLNLDGEVELAKEAHFELIPGAIKYKTPN